MAKGINISVASDTRDFASGVKAGIIDPLDDAAKALDDLDHTNLSSVERSLKDAQKATEDNEAEYKKLGNVIRQTSRQSTNDFELDSREKRRLSRETVKEIGNEAKQNAAETFSSFDGSAQSFVDGIQGTLGGLVSSLGPIGLAVGAAGALAIGLVNGALQNANQQTDEFKQSVSDLTKAFIEDGDYGVAATNRLVENMKKLATETDSSKQSLSRIKAEARETGVNFSSLADAFAGDSKAIKEAIDLTKQKIAVDEKLAAGGADIARRDQVRAQVRHGDEVQQLNDLQALADKQREASENEALYAKTSAAANQLKADTIKQVDSAYDEAAGSVDDYVNKESGLLDTDKYIAAMQAKQKALQDYQTDLAASGLSDQAKGFLAAQGEDAAATLIQAYIKGSDAQKAALSQIWNEAGKTSSGAFTNALEQNLPKSVQLPVVLDLKSALNTLDTLTRPRTVQVSVSPAGRLAEKLL